MEKVTIAEIALLAGVSKATVSRVLNNKPDVKPETKERIMTLISQYNFKPNAFATAVSMKKSKTIGLLAPQGTEYIYTNPFYSRVLHGVSTEVNRRGYYLMFCYVGKDDYVDVYQRNMVEGFILLSPGMEHQNLIANLQDVRAPFISTTEIPGLDDSHYIDIDNYSSATLAVEHLISLGHRQIAIINSFSSLMANKERLRGYSDTLKKHDIPVDESLIREGPPTFENGFKKMMSFHEKPTAVFACSDMAALGAIEAVKKQGREVPANVSVVGFDDINFASNFGLTTIRQPIFDKGKYAARMLINLIEGKDVKKQELSVKLVVRETSGMVQNIQISE